MIELNKLKDEVIEVVVSYFGAAGKGPGFIRKIEELFLRAKKEDDHGREPDTGTEAESKS
jgi:hypothetical protein